jgi:protein ImuB
VAGVRQLWLTFEVPPHRTCPVLQRPITFEQTVSQATRSAGHLRSLLALRLEQLSLGTFQGEKVGVSAVVLWARRTEPLDAWQEELFDTGRSGGSGVAELVDRLVNRLGAAAVVRPVRGDDHLPERDFVYQPVVQEGIKGVRHLFRPTAAEKGASPLPPRPLRLLVRPVEVRVIALAPEGPPCHFDWQGVSEQIVECVGPERLESGWWRGVHVCRDYFRVACRSGRRCWLFRRRDTGRWFLHGWFD